MPTGRMPNRAAGHTTGSDDDFAAAALVIGDIDPIVRVMHVDRAADPSQATSYGPS
jgi:hypothetical protein